jgi:hypothetical protein
MTAEEGLRRAEQYAAMIRYLADVTGEPHEVPNRAALAGLADVCEQIEHLIGSVRRSLSSSALGTVLRSSN